MYNYQDFKHKFGDIHAEIKLLNLYRHMENNQSYTTEQLVNFASGDSWETLACIDRLVELKLIRCVDNTHSSRNYWVYRKI